mgnify:CR=1 FL=1
MKLRRIEIKNFRTLRSIEIFPQQIMVIIGENNVGKSSLLYALRLLLDPRAEGLRLNLSDKDINSEAKLLGENFFSITVEIGDLQNHIEVETCFRDRISQDQEETFITLQGIYEPDEDGILCWSSYLLPPSGRSNEPLSLSKRMERSVPLYYLDAVRDAIKDTKATGRGLLAQFLSDVDYTDVEEEVLQFLAKANSTLNQGEEISSFSENLTEQLTSHIPGGQSKIALAIAGEDAARLVEGFRLHLRKAPGSNQSDISFQGTGLQNLVLIALFRHQIKLELKNTPILAIEEPEAHLHPHAQRSLYKDLSNIEAPVLLTTHSPSIVRCTDPLSLVILKSTGLDKTAAFQINSQNFSDGQRKNLLNLMRRGMTDVFFSRSILLVEGESELLTLPAFAQMLGCDFDRDGVSLISVDGNDFSSVLKVFSPDNLKIPTTVIYDTDVLSERQNKLLKQAYKAGLISQEVRDRTSQDISSLIQLRKSILDDLNWIGVEDCFEDAVCQHGYLEVILKAIEDVDPEHNSHTRALNAFLRESNLEKNSTSVADFIKKRDNLKVPIARAIAQKVSVVRKIPPCYIKAIRQCMLKSIGSIPVDDFFELRVCSAGFLGVIHKYIQAKSLEEVLDIFLAEEL